MSCVAYAYLIHAIMILVISVLAQISNARVPSPFIRNPDNSEVFALSAAADGATTSF